MGTTVVKLSTRLVKLLSLKKSVCVTSQVLGLDMFGLLALPVKPKRFMGVGKETARAPTPSTSMMSKNRKNESPVPPAWKVAPDSEYAVGKGKKPF
jgi:hypothetical protein